MDNTLEKIYISGQKFLSPLSLPNTYRLVAEEGTSLVKADFSSILLLENKELRLVYTSSPVFYKIKPRKRDFMYKALRMREPVILNIRQITRHHPEIKETQIRSGVILPLFDYEKPIGIIMIMSLQEEYFKEKAIKTLQMFIPLAVLTIQRAQLYDESQKTLRNRDLFISMAAHELKTPLTTIKGYAQLLHSKLSGTDTTESRWTEELSLEIYRLGQLVNELLEIEHIKSGKLLYVWEECCVKEIVDRALLDFRFTRPNNRIVVKNKIAEGEDIIIGDYNKLLQAVINLLDNAAKFSAPNKEVVVTLKRETGCIILEIKDQGKGIPKKDLPLIYQIFYRGENHTGEGMGVGLFLAKNIVAQHRGNINIKSRENKGTTVEVKLPEISI